METQQFGPVAGLRSSRFARGCFPRLYERPGAFVDGVVDGDDGADGGGKVFGRGLGEGIFAHYGVEELRFRGVDPVAGLVGTGFGLGVRGGGIGGGCGVEGAGDGGYDAVVGEGAGGLVGGGGFSGGGGLGYSVGGALAGGGRGVYARERMWLWL